jgi:Tol biopolymer transport system component
VRHPAVVLVLGAVLAAALAPAADATLVFNKGAVSSTPTVWIANDDGSGARKIASGGFGPRISPDGQTVVYQSVYGDVGTRPQLLSIPAAGGKRSILLDPQWDPGTQAWSPDSTTIAAVTGRELGTKRLVLIDVATGATRTVATGQFYGVSFSPTGNAIVYSRASRDDYPAHSSLWLATVTGGKPTRITSGHSDASPLWGPQAVVFSRMRKPPRRYDAPKQDLYVMSPAGGGPRRLTFQHPSFLLYGLTPVSWSDDGTHLLAAFGGQDTDFGQTVDPANGTVRTIGHQSDGIVGSALSHDGTTILATRGAFGEPSNRTDVVAIPYAGGKQQVLARHAFSPDWNK